MEITAKQIYRSIDLCLKQNLRFSGITMLQAMTWLDNFHKKDWHLALKVLNTIKFVSEDEVYNNYAYQLNKVLRITPSEKKIFLSPSKSKNATEGFGKSGTLMSYYLNKVIADLSDEDKERVKLISNIQLVKRNATKAAVKNNILVIYDDYIGSGKQITNYIRKTVIDQYGHYLENVTIMVLSMYINSDGLEYLQQEFSDISVFAETRVKAFARRGSVFGYPPRMIPVREFCHEYGKQFTVAERKDNGKKEYIPIPLGYENSQGLIVFCYRPPNNTLPIIWSGQNDWYPLFPRFINDKISQLKNYRRETTFLLNLAKENGFKTLITGRLEKGRYVRTYITQEDMLLFCVMRLMRQTSSIPVICQKLNISIGDFEEIMNDGIHRELFSNEYQFTEKGAMLYKNVISLKSVYDEPDFWKKGFQNPNDFFYLPTQFQGKT